MKTVTITGGTGSLGKTLLQYFLSKPDDYKEIRILSRDEEKQLSLRRSLIGGHGRVKFYLGNVRDSESLKRPFQGSDLIVHAAAMKQVDTCEEFASEAIATNVIGAQNVCSIAAETSPRCIAISTDKAALPLNCYGMTKALQEKIFCNWPSGSTIFSAVRYGNVIGSRGSVVPYFSELVSQKRNLPITNVEMTRFWLRLVDAVQIIEDASQEANHGEIWIPQMRASKITDLAEVMSPVPWYVIGLRPGEKIHEDIVSGDECHRAFIEGGYIKILPHDRVKDMNIPPIDHPVSSNSVSQLTPAELKELLQIEGWGVVS